MSELAERIEIHHDIVPIRVQEISDEVLWGLYHRIKPLKKDGGGVMNFLSYVEDISLLRSYEIRKIEEYGYARRAPHLKRITTFQSYHSSGYGGRFQPSIAEVLVQIPHELLDRVVGFEIVGHFPVNHIRGSKDDLDPHGVMVRVRHVATVDLYSK